MNIIIDGRPWTATSAGIASFLRGCLIAWATASPADRFIVVLPRRVHPSVSLTDLPSNVSLVIYTLPLLYWLPNLVWLHTFVPFLVRKYRGDLYFSALPSLPFGLPRRVRKVIVVHDVVNIEYRDTMQWTNRLANVFFGNALKHADIVWTNSYYTRSRLQALFPRLMTGKPVFTGCAVDRKTFHRLSLSADEQLILRKKHDLPPHFILFVGSLEPRKNLSLLLRIMPAIYQTTGRELVVVGGKGWKNNDISRQIQANDALKSCTRFCGYVTDEDLSALYNMADCFVSTSLNEGFGMPQLEALLCGCPIVTAQNSGMREVAEGKKGATLVESYEPKAWTDAIITVLQQRPMVDLEQLKAYDWALVLSRFIHQHLHYEARNRL